METLILNVSPEQVSKKMLFVQRMTLGAMGIVNTVNWIFVSGTLRYVNLITGIVCLFFAIRYRYDPKMIVYSLSDAGIESPEAQDEKALIPWSDVAFIEHAPLRLTISAKSGRRLDINLGSLSYAQHQTIKPQIQRFAQVHGVVMR